jgi:beta-glucosidase
MQQYKDNNITYSKGVALTLEETSFIREVKVNETDRTGMKEAEKIAKGSDVVVMVLGEHGFQSGEGRSRTVLDLPGLQQELLEKIYAVNKNIVLVLMNGRPLAIPWAAEHIPAIVEAWHLGSQSGHAVAQVLYGDHNPSGKLPMSFPRNEGQIPIYYNHKNTGRPDPTEMVFWSHYSDQSNDPLYSFGHGLSYTSFTYSNLDVQISKSANQVTINVTVKNSGERDGEEVVQLYIRDLVASVTRPVKELKGFQKIALEPDQQKVVTFDLMRDDFSFYDNQGKLVFEPGDFTIMVGGNSVEGLTYAFEL